MTYKNEKHLLFKKASKSLRKLFSANFKKEFLYLKKELKQVPKIIIIMPVNTSTDITCKQAEGKIFNLTSKQNIKTFGKRSESIKMFIIGKNHLKRYSWTNYLQQQHKK